MKDAQWPRPIVCAPDRATKSVGFKFFFEKESRRVVVLLVGAGMLAIVAACVAKFRLSLLPKGISYCGPPDCKSPQN